ncbi:MAG: DUF3365 domain-containing protein [Pseudomonadota bacterium]
MYYNAGFRISLISTIAICIFSHCAYANQDDNIIDTMTTEEYEREAQQRIKAFGKALKQTLVNTIKSEGFPAAVDVCSVEAPEIANALSTDGWDIGRTSLRVRNIDNAPDQWESDVLVAFDQNYKSGAKPETLATSSIDDNQFRFMKAIPTSQVCLACHGQSINSGLLETINEHYPNDQAIGFTLQDIRGAFTLSKQVN